MTLTKKIAKRLMEELEVKLEDFKPAGERVGKTRLWCQVFAHIKAMKPATLGIIAANHYRGTLQAAATNSLMATMHILLEGSEWESEGEEPEVVPLAHCDRCHSNVAADLRCGWCGAVLPQSVCALPFQGAELHQQLKEGVELFGVENFRLPTDQYHFFVLKPQALIGRSGKLLVFEKAIVALSNQKVMDHTQVGYVYTEVRNFELGRRAKIVAVKHGLCHEFSRVGDYVDYDYGLSGHIVGKDVGDLIWLSLTAWSPEEAMAEHQFLAQRGEITA